MRRIYWPEAYRPEGRPGRAAFKSPQTSKNRSFPLSPSNLLIFSAFVLLFSCLQPQVKPNLGEKTNQFLGIRTKGLKVVEAGQVYQLREPQVSYLTDFGLKNALLGL
jgi:hypothetical protein